jgi:hypothetical protein
MVSLADHSGETSTQIPICALDPTLMVPQAFFAWGAAIEGAEEIKTGSMARLLPRRVGA